MNKLENIFKVLIICHFVLLQVSVTWSKGQARIVGGMPSSINNATYVLQLYKDGHFRCGATLISEYYALTAGHCIYNANPANLTIVGGASTLDDPGVGSTISKIKMSANFNNNNFTMDYALLKLRRRISGPLVQPIGLCNQKLKQGNWVQIYGWGKRTETAPYASNQLYTAYVNVVANDICAYLNRDVMNVTELMFCAIGNGQDACTGDSGGPAIFNGTLCGIISWGYGCNRPNYPGVLTDVYQLRNFIQYAIQD